MNKRILVLSAVMAVVFDLIACLGDSNKMIYSVFMGLCGAAFCVYVYSLFRIEFSAKKEFSETEAKSVDSYREAA